MKPKRMTSKFRLVITDAEIMYEVEFIRSDDGDELSDVVPLAVDDRAVKSQYERERLVKLFDACWDAVPGFEDWVSDAMAENGTDGT